MNEKPQQFYETRKKIEVANVPCRPIMMPHPGVTRGYTPSCPLPINPLFTSYANNYKRMMNMQMINNMYYNSNSNFPQLLSYPNVCVSSGHTNNLQIPNNKKGPQIGKNQASGNFSAQNYKDEYK